MADFFICDDEHQIIELLSETLEGQGHQVAFSNSAEGLVDKLLEKPFGALILDYKMPGKDGRQVLTEVREKFSPAQLPVIFSTAYGEKDLVIDVVRLGINGFIVKPYDINAVVPKIESTMMKIFVYSEVKAMMVRAVMPDSKLSDEVGLESFSQRKNSLFRIPIGVSGDFVVLANSSDKSLKTMNQWSEEYIFENIKIFRQVGPSKAWHLAWPTPWELPVIR